MHSRYSHAQDSHRCSCEAGIEAWTVFWSIIRSERNRANHTSHTSHGYNSGCSECSPPLTHNIIGLVGHRCRHVAVASCGDEEGAKVSNIWLFCIAEYCDADDLQNAVEDDDVASDVELVGDVGFEETQEERECVALSTVNASYDETVGGSRPTGAVRHCDKTTEKFSESRRMIGKKYDTA